MPIPKLSLSGGQSKSGGDFFSNPNIDQDNSFSFGGASRSTSESGDGSIIKASTTSATKLPLYTLIVLTVIAGGFLIKKLS